MRLSRMLFASMNSVALLFFAFPVWANPCYGGKVEVKNNTGVNITVTSLDTDKGVPLAGPPAPLVIYNGTKVTWSVTTDIDKPSSGKIQMQKKSGKKLSYEPYGGYEFQVLESNSSSAYCRVQSHSLSNTDLTVSGTVDALTVTITVR